MNDPRWADLKATFANTVGLPEQERRRRVAELLETDPDLGARLRVLLQAHDQADEILDGIGPALGVVPADPTSTESSPDPLSLLHRTVGDFEIRDLLGSGGVGVIYGAVDRNLGRRVALKFLQPRFAEDPAAGECFLREARAASRLDHAHVCTILEVGRSEASGPYIAMPRYDGDTLAARVVRAAPLPLGEVVRIAREILSALAHAHDRGVVHCDLKPGNVLFTGDGAVKVADFGLARVRETEAHDPSNRPGTVAYMSPEQVKGVALDLRTDLWSLGVVVHELLTGTKPFGRGHDLVTLYSILHGHAVPPSLDRSDVPPAFDAFCARLLEKDPDDRWGSAAEALAALDRVVSQRGVQAPRPALRRGAHERPAGLEPVSLAVLPLRTPDADSDATVVAEGLATELVAELSRVDGLRVTGWSSSLLASREETEPAELALRLGVTHLLVGACDVGPESVRVDMELLSGAGGRRIRGRRYTASRADLTRLRHEIAADLAEALEVPLPDSASGEHRVSEAAYDLFLRGRFFAQRRSEEGLARAEDYFRRAIDAAPDFARAHAGLAEALVVPRAGAPAERFRLGRVAALRALELDPTLAEAEALLGWIGMWYDRDWSGAEARFRRALSLAPGYLWAHQWHSAWLAAVGRTEEALIAMRRAAAIDPLSVPTLTHVGSQLFWLGRYEEALDQCRRALALDPGFHMARWGVGRALQRLGRHAEAIAEFRHPGTDLVGFFQPALLGHALAVSGDDEAARKILDELRATIAGGGYVSPTDVAAIHIGLGEYDHALEWLARHEADRGARVCLKVDPMFDPLRDDRRFEALLMAVGLAEV